MGEAQQGAVRMKLPRELAAGGMSCATASAFLNPMDAIKVRIQVQAKAGATGQQHQGVLYRGLSHGLRRVYAEEGLRGLFLPGLAASMLREVSYSSLRVGLYPLARNTFSALIGKKETEDAGFLLKALSGLATGAIGSALANPTDLVKIRMQGEAGRLGPDGRYETGLARGQRPLYRNLFHGFASIFREGGVGGLYLGVTTTMTRAALLTSGQLASYDHTKHVLKSRAILEDGTTLHIVASLVAGVTATTFCAPADIVKTRIMNDTSGQYRGAIDCLQKIVRNEGPHVLFRGWLPGYLRLGPHFIISLPLLEQFRRLFGLGYFT